MSNGIDSWFTQAGHHVSPGYTSYGDAGYFTMNLLTGAKSSHGRLSR